MIGKLHVVELLLLLVFGLAVTLVVDVRILGSQIVDLLLEDVIDLLLIHLLLLLGSEADSSCKFLHFALNALGHCLARLVSEKSYHLPTTKMKLVKSILGVTKVVELLLDVFLGELSKISLGAGHSLGVLDSRI